MPVIYHPRRPRASPLWQIVTAAWGSFVASYEKIHRAAMGPLRAKRRGWRVSPFTGCLAP
jgi:hypothetical protein